MNMINLEERLGEIAKYRQQGLRHKQIAHNLGIKPWSLYNFLYRKRNAGIAILKNSQVLEQRNQSILERYNAGESVRNISEDLKLYQSAIFQIIRNFRKTGVYVRPNRLKKHGDA